MMPTTLQRKLPGIRGELCVTSLLVSLLIPGIVRSFRPRPPPLEVVPSSLDAGRLARGEVLPLSFSIHNPTDRELEVRLVSSCECLELDASRLVLAAHSSLGIGARLRGKGQRGQGEVYGRVLDRDGRVHASWHVAFELMDPFAVMPVAAPSEYDAALEYRGAFPPADLWARAEGPSSIRVTLYRVARDRWLLRADDRAAGTVHLYHGASRLQSIAMTELLH